MPFLDTSARLIHPVFGVDDATTTDYWNIAIRNSCHNYSNRDAVEYTTKSNTSANHVAYDLQLDPMEFDGFYWRKRRSLDGKYKSFRMTWGKSRSKGKKEFYIGWTMNETPKMRLTIQLRPF